MEETVGDMKKWLSTYYNLINVVVLLAIFLITLVIILGLGFIKVLYLLFVLLVLTMLAIGLQVSAAYLALSPKNYEGSYQYIHEAIHTTRNVYHYLELCDLGDYPYSEETFKEYLTSALTAMALAFSMTTGKSCRTCVKWVLPSDKKDEYLLETLARDRKSTNECKEVDEKDVVVNLAWDHIANGILSGKINYYVSNDLRKTSQANYLRLLFDRYPKKHHISDEWKLPYLSTIFAPIRYTPDRDELSPFIQYQSKQSHIPVYFGFFAVDSAHTDTFSESECQMANAFCDALFSVLNAYNKLLQRLTDEPNF